MFETECNECVCTCVGGVWPRRRRGARVPSAVAVGARRSGARAGAVRGGAARGRAHAGAGAGGWRPAIGLGRRLARLHPPHRRATYQAAALRARLVALHQRRTS